MFLDLSVLQRLVLLAQQKPEISTYVHMYMCTYIFLLRLPSECLPIAVGSGLAASVKAHSLTVSEESVVLYLPCRKNRMTESRITRVCWCASCKLTCPVHSLGAWMQQQGAGASPFKGISPGEALQGLRALLAELEVPMAGLYRYSSPLLLVYHITC